MVKHPISPANVIDLDDQFLVIYSEPDAEGARVIEFKTEERTRSDEELEVQLTPEDKASAISLFKFRVRNPEVIRQVVGVFERALEAAIADRAVEAERAKK